MRWFVYVLKSERDGKQYFGCTKDIAKRMARHQRGAVRSTRNRGPFVLVHSEEFEGRAEAFAREKFLKSWAGRIELTRALRKKDGTSGE